MIPHGRLNMPRGWKFQQDNDPKHTSGHNKTHLKKQKVKVLEWPSQSPDLNPIEHLWEELDWCVRQRNCTNKEAFIKELYEHWKTIPKERFAKLMDSIPSRCAAVINAKGYAQKY